ncbi:MAG: hypothetical protein ABI054_12145 [Planctomycetota bacterium]
MRVVDIGNGNFEQRKVELTVLEAPWIFAAERHLEWLTAHL